MSAATVWDDKFGEYRSMTQAEIEAMRDGMDAFIRLMNEYIDVRNSHMKWNFRCPHVDLSNNEQGLDISDGIVTVRWIDNSRYHDRTELDHKFPLSHLWASNWEETIAVEIEAERQREETKRKELEEEEAVKKAAKVARQETEERAMLAMLQAKYKGAL